MQMFVYPDPPLSLKGKWHASPIIFKGSPYHKETAENLFILADNFGEQYLYGRQQTQCRVGIPSIVYLIFCSPS